LQRATRHRDYALDAPDASAGNARAYELRAKLRSVTESERERRCGVCSVRDAGPGIQATGRPGNWDTKWIGVLTCGHIWTCPPCAAKLRTERLARVLRAVEVGGSTWQMLTATVRHRDGMPLRSLHRGLMQAWRRARQGGATQRIWKERVRASVRAVEITHGANGWHPHLHVLLQTDGFTEEEKQTLLERWLLCVERELGPACVPDAAHALRWSTPIDVCKASEVDRARYLVKLGLEVAGPKQGRAGSATPWQIAEAAAEGDSQARAWWTEFSRATKGRRMIELDDRAQRYAKTPRDLGDELEGKLGDPLERVVVPVDSLELRALREYEQRFDPGILAVMTADVAKCEKPAEVVRRWIDLVTACLGYNPEHGKGETRSSAESDTQGRQRAGPIARGS
jgi:Replication protein